MLDVIAVAQRRFRTNKKLERLARTYREFMAETVGDQIVEEVGTRALLYDQLSSEQRAELVVDLLADVSGLIDQQTAQPLPFRDLVINPGLTEHILVQEQSYCFASVAAWLLSRAGGRYARVSAYLDQWTAEARSALEAQATALTPKTAPAVVREPAEWSVLFFLGADTGRVFEGKYGKYSLMSNLSKFGRELLEQVQAAASNDRVAVLALACVSVLFMQEATRDYFRTSRTGWVACRFITEAVKKDTYKNTRLFDHFLIE